MDSEETWLNSVDSISGLHHIVEVEGGSWEMKVYRACLLSFSFPPSSSSISFRGRSLRTYVRMALPCTFEHTFYGNILQVHLYCFFFFFGNRPYILLIVPRFSDT